MAIDPTDFASVTPTLADKVLITQTNNGDQPGVTTFSEIKTLVTPSATNYLANAGKIVTNVSAGNLTLALKLLDGSDPSTSTPLTARIGDVEYTISFPLSVTIAAGTNTMNLGSSELAGRDTDLFAYLGHNATDGVTLGAARFSNANTYSDFSTTPTNEKYAAISSTAHASGSDPYVVIGRFNATLSAGASYNWTIGTSIIKNGPIYETRSLVWLPTYTALDALLAPAGTYNATQTATYKIGYGTCLVRVYSDGTTSSTPLYLTATLPFTPASAFATGCLVNDGNTAQSGTMEYDGTRQYLKVARYNSPSANFAAGVSETIKGNTTYII